jgi:predicted DNA binding protein
MIKKYKAFEIFMAAKHLYNGDNRNTTQKDLGITSFIKDNFGESSYPLKFNLYPHIPPQPNSEIFQEGREIARKEYLLFQLLTPNEVEVLTEAYNRGMEVQSNVDI